MNEDERSAPVDDAAPTAISTPKRVSATEAENRQQVRGQGFSVSLSVYSGPFDALLTMIANRKLELTEVSLSAITEEFIDYVRGLDMARDMEQVSAFLDVASVLVEAKSAAILPGDENGERDEQSMEALRERDLLFARLVQYRAFKSAANNFRELFAVNSGRFPHPAFSDPPIAAMLPELAWTLGPEDLARIAVEVFLNAPADEVRLDQLHVSQVDLKAQSQIVRDRLRGLTVGDSMTFGELTSDAASKLVVVARFLAILLFFKQGVLQYKQSGPFEDLHLRWVPGADNGDDAVEVNEGDFA
ncbi:segregation/condensation protein A [Bifidobacterium sp. ESL0800]|uniref:segregation and condensation protein A n=1 Tax=Bifidobacterium sp. ESL0800 TaxID=2983236 RepID=UPI0023F9CBD4|nr:segregation/condensation protein A [Bifidobacterium sp. ESL0800]WEV76425.1 segregation/condensation protein A [Bifidobacterium sp. ESL0800]